MVNARTVLLVNVDLYCTEEGDGPPLLVHHGGPGLDHTVIAPHLSPLAQNVPGVLRPPGHGTFGRASGA